MAALRLDQARTGAVSAIVGTGEAQVTPRPGRYEIDTSCSAVTFRTRHLFGLAPVRGSFTIRAGTIDVAEPLADSSVHVHIDPASFRTGNGQRDSAVRSERVNFCDEKSSASTCGALRIGPHRFRPTKRAATADYNRCRDHRASARVHPHLYEQRRRPNKCGVPGGFLSAQSE